MAKRKSDAISCGNSSSTAAAAAAAETNEREKRPKMALNFSIESIMQREPSPPIKLKLEKLDRLDRLEMPESPSTSSSGSTCSSAHVTVDDDNLETAPLTPSPLPASVQLQQQQHQRPSSGSLSNVRCILDNKDMWDKFHALNTEMIITKTGRRMFPVMKVQFQNLKPNATYRVYMDIIPVDSKRYRYAYHKSCWQVAGKADPSQTPRLYQHPDSPFQGEMLARQVISFEKVKLTNNETDTTDHIILNSMHKYQPRVYLMELKSAASGAGRANNGLQLNSNHSHHQHQHQHHNSSHNQQHNHNQRINQAAGHQLLHRSNSSQLVESPLWDIEECQTFVFPETVFTAVTAYQNQLITKLKIDKNPFAKGFRDSSRLSDLDRSDPFDYMAPNASRYQVGGQSNGHLDAYQLLASAANNPWYSAAALAAVSGAAGGPNPFGSPQAAMAGAMGALCNSVGQSANAHQAASAQAAQLQATQMMLAAFNACLSQGGAAAAAAAAAAASAAQGGGGPVTSSPSLMCTEAPAHPASLLAGLSSVGARAMANGMGLFGQTQGSSNQINNNNSAQLQSPGHLSDDRSP